MIPFALIWILLAISLVAVLVLVGIRLVRGFLRVLSALSDLAVTTAQLDNVVPTHETQKRPTSVLSPMPDVVTRYLERTARRHELKRVRHEARLDRAYVITHVDVSTREWFPPREVARSLPRSLRRPPRSGGDGASADSPTAIN